MAFVDIRPTVHLGRLAAGETPFSAAIPTQHPGRLQALEIDEGFEIGKAQLPIRQAFCSVRLRDQRADYEARRLQAGDILVVQDADDGGAPTVRFRGRIRKPRIRDEEHGRIEIEIEAHGLWTRLRQAADVSVPVLSEASGKQTVDAVLDQVPWPTSFRDVPVPVTGADARYTQWAFDGPPADGISNALSGINPRSRFYVDAAGIATAIWLSSDIEQFRAGEVRPAVSREDSELHVINQVVATALDVTRTTTTRWDSTAIVDLDDDADVVVFEGTLEGDDLLALWAFEFRQPNGTYFPYHAEVNGSLTAVHIRGTTLFRVVATARARSGTYTTVTNFFRIRSTVVSLTALTEAPIVRNLNNTAPDEPRQFIVPALSYPAGHAEILADNYLTLWGLPLQFLTFETVANDDAKLAKIRGVHLWRRVSLFDGNDTHFGFVVRRRWVYGPTYSVVHFTMMEDFTEGGDISIPFRLPFEWVFVNIAALDSFFARTSTLNNQGAWADEVSGSTPTNNTGPTGNNALAFVHTETSGGNRADHEDNGILTLDDDVFSVIENRDVVFRYAAYGDFAAGDGLVVQGRTVVLATVEDLIVVNEEGPGLVRATVWRINTSDPDDTTAPFGELGSVPPTIFDARAIGLDANGDLLVVNRTTRDLWRINLADTDDETGDYGLIGRIYSGPNAAEAAALDQNGDLIVVSGGVGLYRVSVATPSLESGIYGRVGTLPAGVSGTTGSAMFSDGRLAYAVGLNLWIAPANDLVAPVRVTGQMGAGLKGLDVDAADDLWGVSAAGDVWKINPADPTQTTGGYGNQGAMPSGIDDPEAAAIVGREIQNFGAWTDIATLPASTYPAGNLSEGDTDTDVEGDDYTVAADGGWRDVTVGIPNTYQQIRLRPNLNAGGNAARQDMALRSVRSA